MRTLTFTDEEYEWIVAYADAPRSFISEAAAVLRAAIGRGTYTEPAVTGHDTVWLMAHEG